MDHLFFSFTLQFMESPNQEVLFYVLEWNLMFSKASHLPLQTPGEGFLNLITVPIKNYIFCLPLQYNETFRKCSSRLMILLKTVIKLPWNLPGNNLSSSNSFALIPRLISPAFKLVLCLFAAPDLPEMSLRCRYGKCPVWGGEALHGLLNHGRKLCFGFSF